jgi:hypothetical protein
MTEPAPPAGTRTRFPIIDLEGPKSVEMTLEQRYELLHNVFKHLFFAVYRHIGEIYGWEAANKIAGDVSDESTPILVGLFKEKFGLEGSGAELVSKVMQVEFFGEGSDIAVLAESPDHAELDILCGMGDALRKPRFAIPIADGLCERGCRLWAADLARSVDPDLTVERLTWMGDGAPRCLYHISRATPAQAAPA